MEIQWDETTEGLTDKVLVGSRSSHIRRIFSKLVYSLTVGMDERHFLTMEKSHAGPKGDWAPYFVDIVLWQCDLDRAAW